MCDLWGALMRGWPALRSRNYRLFIAGQAPSLIGTFLQMVAMSWLVYRLTHSALILGLVGFVGELPAVPAALLAGVLADRVRPHRIMLATQSLAMLQAVLLALLVFAGRLDVPIILCLSCVLGILNGIDAPARQVLLAHLVESREQLASAIALHSLVYDSARLIGPALGGMVIAWGGEGVCFLANGVSYLAILGALLALRHSAGSAETPSGPVLPTLVEGIRYVCASPPIRAVLLFVGCICFAGSPYGVLMPIMAATVLKGGPHTLGILVASIGMGALLGAAWLGSRRTGFGLDRTIVLGAGLFGLGLILFSLSPSLSLSVALLVMVGCGITLIMASSNTILLMIADADKRGRVMSLFALSFMGTVPLGNLCSGALAGRIGTPATIALGGGVCLLSGLIFLRELSRIRPRISVRPGGTPGTAARPFRGTERSP